MEPNQLRREKRFHKLVQESWSDIIAGSKVWAESDDVQKACQVIIPGCCTLKNGSLPDISYQAGSLENEKVRKQVCQILEGGEEAFKDRAKRLRING